MLHVFTETDIQKVFAVDGLKIASVLLNVHNNEIIIKADFDSNI